MTSAFASVISVLFADPNIGRDAVYIAEGKGLNAQLRDYQA